MNFTFESVHIENDSVTTVAYINKLRGCHSISLNNITKNDIPLKRIGIYG